jgi:hypothetical protein
VLRQLTDGTQVGSLRTFGHTLCLQVLFELFLECCHSPFLLVEKLMLTGDYNKDYDGTHCEQYKQKDEHTLTGNARYKGSAAFGG